ncbi:MAG TPA: DUF5672 family protein [Acidobacteriota bacterium]|jgi:hypothetical protein
MSSPSHSIVVVVPWFKERLTAEEQISLRHLDHYLGAYDICRIGPNGISSGGLRYPLQAFEADDFRTASSYSRLLLTSRFYRRFQAYEFMLIYQLDCLVFCSDLGAWCRGEYDYIGAPWVRTDSDGRKRFTRVGNGGLSLRRIESFLRVIESPRTRPWYDSKQLRMAGQLPDVRELPGWQGLKKQLSVLRELHQGPVWYVSNYSVNEDRFWSDRARLFDPDFSIAPVEVGLRFAFECEPRFCFEQLGRQLPFGCHGWARYDRGFWEPYLLA